MYEIGKEYLIFSNKYPLAVGVYQGIDSSMNYTLMTYHRFGNYSIPEGLLACMVFPLTPLLKNLF